MVKVITLLKRKSGTTKEEFLRHWYERHAQIALKMPGIRRYIQNHPVKTGGRGEPQFDGVAELWFDDMESWRKCADFYLGDEGAIVREDEQKFLDMDQMIFFLAEERLIKK